MIGSVLLMTATLLVAVETNVLIQVDISPPKYITNNGKTEFVESKAEVQCSPPYHCRRELKGNRFVLNSSPAVMQDLMKMTYNSDTVMAKIEIPPLVQPPSSTTISPWKLFKNGFKTSRQNRRKERRLRTSSTTTEPPTTTMTTTTTSATTITTASTTTTPEEPWAESTTTEIFETISTVSDEEILDTDGTTEKETALELEGEDYMEITRENSDGTTEKETALDLEGDGDMETTTENISPEKLVSNATSTSKPRPWSFWG